MTRQIEEIIAENRRRIRQTDARAIELGDTGRTDLSFARNTVRVVASVGIEVRDIGGGLVSGHPAPEHGSGRGVAGDVRGDWTTLTETTETAAFTTSGANAVRDALDGQTGAISQAAVGSDSTQATRGDTALVSEDGRRGTWGRRTANATTVRAVFPFSEHGESVEEVGVFDGSGRLLARTTVPTQSVSVEQELRASVTLTVTGEAPGSAVFTDEGAASVAAALRSDAETVGLAEFAFGTGSGEFSPDATGLHTEAFRSPAARSLSPAAIAAYTVVYASEPAGQMPLDISEMGVYDSDGRLLWATTVEAFEKTDEAPFSATVGFAFE